MLVRGIRNVGEASSNVAAEVNQPLIVTTNRYKTVSSREKKRLLRLTPDCLGRSTIVKESDAGTHSKPGVRDGTLRCVDSVARM